MRTTGRERFTAFVYGVAHTFDLLGIMALNRGRYGRGFAGDAEALRADWARAVQRVSDENRRKRDRIE